MLRRMLVFRLASWPLLVAGMPTKAKVHFVVTRLAVFVLSALLLAARSAHAQTVSADVGFAPSSNVGPNPVLPGSPVSLIAVVENLGPTFSLAPLTVTGTLPPEFILNSCTAFAFPNNYPCTINGSTVTISLDFSLQAPSPVAGIDIVDIFISGTLSPSVASGSGPFAGTFTVSAPSPDPNPANNTFTFEIYTPSPIVATVSPAQPDFGFTPLNFNAPPLQITFTNAGKSPFDFLGNLPPGSSVGPPNGPFVSVPPLAPPFFWEDTSCTGPPGTVQFNAFQWLLMPGASCVITAAFEPTSLGPAEGTLTFIELQETTGQFAQQAVKLTGYGSNVGLFPRSLSFPLTLDASDSQPEALQLVNTGPIPVSISSIVTIGNFSEADDCAGVVAPQSGCNVLVTFRPSVAGPASGSLIVKDSDVGSLLTSGLSGTGTAVKLSRDPNVPIAFETDAGSASSAQIVTVADTSTQPLDLGDITVTGDFIEHDTCPHQLHSGQSCNVSLSYRPTQDGSSKGTLTLAESDPGSPQAFQLQGTGVGTDHGVIFLHYDYLVAPDHTHDPEMLAPGAIQQVVETFARHGIVLIIDPRHTAIPEVAPPQTIPSTFPYFSTIVFGSGDCGGTQGFVNFYDLKAKYFDGKNPRTHYTIFGHEIANADPSDPFSCLPFFYSGLSELPGQNFVIALSSLDLSGEISASLQREIVAGSFMHELGHNLGLHHGGGFGALEANDTNLKPNYLSIMNYNYIFSGIPSADSVGSSHYSSCSTDQDCIDGARCIDVGIKPGPVSNSCFRLDYSRQVLPNGGNTPGALKETDLNEPAGLGSGNQDLIFYPIQNCHDIQIAPSNGPVDWDGDGSASNLHARANLIMDVLFERCSAPLQTVHGFDDWKALTTNLDATEALNAASGGAPQPVAREMDMETVKQNHLRYPPRPAQIVVHPGCNLPRAPIAPGQPGTVTITIPGTGSLDVRQVETSSLTFHGLRPLTATISDSGGAGQADLVMTFDLAQLQLNPQKKEVRLTGWLKNGQRFVASAPVTIVNDMSTQPTACRN